MKSKSTCLIGYVMVIVVLLSTGAAPAEGFPADARDVSNAASPGPRLLGAAGQAPLLFIQNQGQLDSRVAYSIQGQDSAVYFTANGLTFTLNGPGAGADQAEESAANPMRWVLKLDFLGASPGTAPQGQERAETVISYFTGSPDQWHTGLPTFRRLAYANVWPGIDLIFSGAASGLKYEFVVHPGADPAQIQLAYRGASSLKLDSSGRLEVSTPWGSLRDEAPTAYQPSAGKQVAVPVAYALPGGSLPGADEFANRYGFRRSYSYRFAVGKYDPSLPLIIDPTVILYCGFIGGGLMDLANDIAVDSNGAAYITGTTQSTQATFPDTAGPDLSHNGGKDAFIAKVRADGTGLVYAGYIGGAADDEGISIAVDQDRYAYVVGKTASDQATFPHITGPDLTYNGGTDAFIAKVRIDGTALVYAGYIGGLNEDVANGVVVNTNNYAYVVGTTGSNQETFPVAVGPDLSYNGGRDAFVARVTPSGATLDRAGYIGGAGDERGSGIALGSLEAVTIAGDASSTETTFPVTVGPDLTHNGGTYDGFVARVRLDGTGLTYAGYLGGNGVDIATDIAVDGNGAAYITGRSNSEILNHSGAYDAFVVKVRPDGTALVYGGFIGGAQDDYGNGIAVDASGSAFVSGWTGSDETTFPVKDGPDLTFNGGVYDAFIARVKPGGGALYYAGYIGGEGNDTGNGIALDGSGIAYIVGQTGSNELTFPVSVGPDLTYNSGSDAFVARVSYFFHFFLPYVD